MSLDELAIGLLIYIILIAALVGVNVYRLIKKIRELKDIEAKRDSSHKALESKFAEVRRTGVCKQHVWVENRDVGGGHYLKCLICRKEPGQMN